jgi:radical SAM superfamily enzyme YgiQ (UPF0313 family)
MPRKKILLYNPISVFFDMPLALLAIGSMLDASHYEVVIIDGRILRDPLRKLLEHAGDALLLGITALTGSPLRDALKISRAIKERYPLLPIIWGGWHPSLFPVETLEDEISVDITVQGQGEITFRNLVMCIEAKASLDSVPGITYRRSDGSIRKNPGSPMQDLNDLERLNYNLIDVESYFRKKGQRQFDYISSTGCHFRCTFCADPFVYDRKWTGLDPEQLVADIAYWQKRLGFNDINFQDETFFTKRRRVIEIANGFLRQDIKTTWAGTMRADQGARMSEDDFDLCKKSGLRRVLVGVESGSQAMLDWLKKDIQLEQVHLVAERCAKRDIAVIFPFIVGFPNESEESVTATLKMARYLNSMHPQFTTPIFYFKPYPGSQITQDIVKSGYNLPNNLEEWADFDYIGSSGPWVDSKKFQLIENFKFYNKLAWTAKFPMLTPLKKIAQFRSNHSFYGFPVEKYFADAFIRSPKLS